MGNASSSQDDQKTSTVFQELHQRISGLYLLRKEHHDSQKKVMNDLLDQQKIYQSKLSGLDESQSENRAVCQKILELNAEAITIYTNMMASYINPLVQITMGTNEEWEQLIQKLDEIVNLEEQL